MRVVLEVTSGSRLGHRALLRANQRLEVGRTDDADFAVEDDPFMSRRHFVLETDQHTCRLTDLGSNGTQVNGQRVDVAYLNDQDRVVAGRTAFCVRVEGARAGITSTLPLPDFQKGVGDTRPSGEHANCAPRCSRQSLASGLERYASLHSAPTAAEVALTLARRIPIYLVVDPTRVERSLIHNVGEPLFTAGDAGGRAPGSPVVVAPQRVPQIARLLEDAWRDDAFVGFFTHAERSQVFSALRQLALFDARGEWSAHADQQFYYWRPSVLRSVLAHGTPQVLERIFDAALAVFLESAEGAWQLFAQPRFHETVAEAGFQCDAPARTTDVSHQIRD